MRLFLCLKFPLILAGGREASWVRAERSETTSRSDGPGGVRTAHNPSLTAI